MKIYKIAQNSEDLERLNSLKPQLIQIAQKIYDSWDDDLREELNDGGICHLIAEDFVSFLSDTGFSGTTWNPGMAENHVHSIIWNEKYDLLFEDYSLEDLNLNEIWIYIVDIHPYVYERGGGYSWEKIEGVVFKEGDISIYGQTISEENFVNIIEY